MGGVASGCGLEIRDLKDCDILAETGMRLNEDSLGILLVGLPDSVHMVSLSLPLPPLPSLSLISNNPEVTVEVLAEMGQQLSVAQRNQAIKILTSLDEHQDK